jgi:hypothetical protein
MDQMGRTNKNKDPTTLTLKVKYLLSIKFYFKSKIVGV